MVQAGKGLTGKVLMCSGRGKGKLAGRREAAGEGNREPGHLAGSETPQQTGHPQLLRPGRGGAVNRVLGTWLLWGLVQEGEAEGTVESLVTVQARGGR